MQATLTSKATLSCILKDFGSEDRCNCLENSDEDQNYHTSNDALKLKGYPVPAKTKFSFLN